MPERPVDSAANRVNDSAVCDLCGHFGAVEFGERLVCPDCYGQNCGSCCPEFGREEVGEDHTPPGTRRRSDHNAG